MWPALEQGLCALVMAELEPIPTLDTFVESDWRLRREEVNGVEAVRVATGYESPEGVPDAQHFRGYWFDGSGQLLKLFANGLEVRRLDFVDFDGIGGAAD